MSLFLKKIFSQPTKNDISFYSILIAFAISAGGGFVFSLSVQVICFIILSLSFSYIFIKKSFDDKYALLIILPLIAACISYLGADFQANIRIPIIALINATSAFFIIIYANDKNKENILITLLIFGFLISLFTFKGSFVSNKYLALNINIVAGFLLLVYPLCFGFIEKNKFPYLFMFLAFVIFAAIAVTKSRSVILSAYAVTFFYFFLFKKNTAFKILFFLITSALLTGLIFAFNYKTDWSSISDRLIWWKAAISMFKDYPISGVGFGNYSALCLTYRPEMSLNTMFTHNSFLQILAETGVVGIIAFIAAAYAVKRNVFINRENGVYDPYTKASLISLSAFLIVNIVDYSLLVPLNMLTFFIIAGIIYKTKTILRKNKKTASIILIPVFFAIYVFSMLLIAEHYYAEGNMFYNTGAYDKAIEMYEKAVIYDSKNPVYWHMIAESEFEMSKLPENIDKSKEYVLRAIKNDLNAEKYYRHSSQLKFGLAYLYKISGDNERAQEYAALAGKYDKFNPYFMSHSIEIQ